MLVNTFVYGACFSLCMCFFVFAYVTRSNKAPYREAFAWSCLVSGLQCFAQLFTILYPDIPMLGDLQVVYARDAMLVPFMLLEIECIYNQNLETFPWKERWRRVVLSEIPFTAFLITALCTDWEYLMLVMYVFIVPFVLYFVVRTLMKLKEYNRILSYTTDSEHRSVKWAAWVFGINIFIIALYSCICQTFYTQTMPLLYIIMVMCLLCAHAYFIFTQRPENTREVEKVRQVLQAQNELIQEELNKKMREVEQQKEVLDVKESHINVLSKQMEENAEKLKRKASIKEYMNTAQLQHPHFDRKLNAVAGDKLTNHDLLLCMLIYEGKRASFIANMIGVNTRSVEMARSRLRKKLQLQPEDKLRETIVQIINS